MGTSDSNLTTMSSGDARLETKSGTVSSDDARIVQLSAGTVNIPSSSLSKLGRESVRKIDLFVLPVLGIFYFLSFLDRTNIGNARTLGLQSDLRLTNHQYSTALTITYVPYIVVEIPMNLLLKRIGPNPMLPLMVTLWGVICACQGAVKSYEGLLACRFFLGAIEGGLFPGIILYLSSFYRRHMMQLRFSVMFSVTSLAGAFSGLLAAAIQNMHGLRGLSGWAWIFILEGVFTSLFGILSLFLLPKTPYDIPFTSAEARSAYMEDLVRDWSGDNEDHAFNWAEVWSVFLHAPHVLLLCVSSFFSGLMLFGLANFTPTVVNALGFSPTHTQLLTAPPYACSFVVSVLCSYIADRSQNKGVLCIIVNSIAIAGYALFLGSSSKHADYAALFLQIIGVYSTVPFLGTWSPNNVEPHYRRATAIALNFMFTNMGGIVSTWIFIDPPRFRVACIVNVCAGIGITLVSGILVGYLYLENRKKLERVEELLREKGDGTDDGGWDSLEARSRLGDLHPRFQYTL